MSPPYIFQINEIGESPAATIHVDSRGQWIPSTDAGANIFVGGGVSGTSWFCNGQHIQPAQLPHGSIPYSVFSMYYCGGYGFLVLRGDATRPRAGEVWRPLTFEHDDRDFSSYLTNAGTASQLRCQRPDQQWPRMLLPDIYHIHPLPTHQTYGGLKGDLPIFLALIAFSMSQENLQNYLSGMFSNSKWRVHGLPNGRDNQRGVVVHVYPCPATWAANSNEDELHRFEEGVYGSYYN